MFDDYVRDRADKERQEKRNMFRKAREDFRKLLEDSKITSRTSYNEFCLHNSKDERFRVIEKTREREAIFNDYVTELRKREREKMIALRDQVIHLLIWPSPIHSKYFHFNRLGMISISC